MNKEIESYKQWLADPTLELELREDLLAIQDKPQEIEERFYTHLSFGTGGLRGVLGAGTNRMNIYTVRKASLGLAHHLKHTYPNKDISVTIAYDCRHKSLEFAKQAALTLAQERIKVHLFPELRPTPQLSYTVRKLKAQAGIVITASHNPPEYNGYKVYGADGAQINLQAADHIIHHIQQISNELEIPVMEEQEAINQGLLQILGADMDQAYIDYVCSLSLQSEQIQQLAEDFHLVFTPLHGTALFPVTQVLEQAGFKHVHVVLEQALIDPNFSTVRSPNPEEQEAFTLAIDYARKHGASLIMGTDPDADRVGVVVKDSTGEYHVLSGNQTGALLLHYLLEQKNNKGELQAKHTICKTIVTSEFGRAIGQAYGLETIDTLTGFKFIGEKIKEYEETGERQFLFGYEESFGYLIGDMVRDKDAIQAVLLVAEMGAYYHAQGLSLLDALQELYKRFGYFMEKLISITMKGKEGLAQIQATLRQLRERPPSAISGIPVQWVEDYQSGIRTHLTLGREEAIHLPAANVIKYVLEDDSWVCVRPSGTEPKLKIYLGVHSKTEQESMAKLNRLADHVQTHWLQAHGR